MSAKHRGSTLIHQEFYPTPSYTVDSILKELDLHRVKSFTEPCRGLGHIYDKVNVPLKYHCELSEGSDYLLTSMPKVDLILTNPPFTLAQQFIIKARKESGCVVMLQRLNYLGSATRKPFWNANPPTHIFVLSNRPKFIAKCTNKMCHNKDSYQVTVPVGTCVDCDKPVRACSDATEYAWFVWNTSSIVYKSPGVYVI